jgi:uncharacterized membrane protein YfcA
MDIHRISVQHRSPTQFRLASSPTRRSFDIGSLQKEVEWVRTPEYPSLPTSMSHIDIPVHLAAKVTLEIAAGIVAGVIGTAGGITSLVSYPALLALGLSPFLANVTNIVALVACWPSSMLASRVELKGQLRTLMPWSLVSVAGGITGSLLLFLTPRTAFSTVAPFLLAGSSLLLLTQPWLSSRNDLRFGRRSSLIFVIGLFLIALYNGYFGAGAGIMLLTLLLFLRENSLSSSNAQKNVLIGAATIGGAFTLITLSSVQYSAAAPLAIGLFLGGLLGPRLSRQLPPLLLRSSVASCGIALSLWLWIR